MASRWCVPRRGAVVHGPHRHVPNVTRRLGRTAGRNLGQVTYPEHLDGATEELDDEELAKVFTLSAELGLCDRISLPQPPPWHGVGTCENRMHYRSL